MGFLIFFGIVVLILSNIKVPNNPSSAPAKRRHKSRSNGKPIVGLPWMGGTPPNKIKKKSFLD